MQNDRQTGKEDGKMLSGPVNVNNLSERTSLFSVLDLCPSLRSLRAPGDCDRDSWTFHLLLSDINVIPPSS